MAGKRSKPVTKYFVPVPRNTVPELLSHSRNAMPDAGTKYFKRSYPLPSELPELWDGSGPDLPPGYAGAEACPDCSAFRGDKHLPLCIRNPNSETWNLSAAWAVIHARQQIFFGAGHPILNEVDGYMTIFKQVRLTKLGVVVMYEKKINDVGVQSVDAEREVIASWRTKHRKITKADIPPGPFDFFNDFDNWSKGREG